MGVKNLFTQLGLYKSPTTSTFNFNAGAKHTPHFIHFNWIKYEGKGGGYIFLPGGKNKMCLTQLGLVPP